MTTYSHLHVLTGAPGTGKTALLKQLDDTYSWVPEPAREVLSEERASGGDGTPEQNADRYVRLLLERSIANYAAVSRSPTPVLFDRGVPDCIAYAAMLGIDTAESIRASALYRYDQGVFVLSPWDQIYTTDDERRMSFEATLDFQREIEAAYRRAGYTLVAVPRASVKERTQFVKSVIST